MACPRLQQWIEREVRGKRNALVENVGNDEQGAHWERLGCKDAEANSIVNPS